MGVHKIRVLLLCLLIISFKGFAAEAPPPLRLVGDGQGNIFNEGEAVKLTLKSATPMSGVCQLELMDASGASLQKLKFDIPGQVQEFPISFQPPARHFIALRATLENRTGEKAESTIMLLPPNQPVDGRLGMNCPSGMSAIVHRIGAKWVRNHIPWEQGAENAPLGKAGIDRVIEETTKGGCQVMGISNYSVPWAGVYDKEKDDRNMRDFFSPPRPAAWDAYVKYAAVAIKGRVPAFEVWNEANFDMFWRSTPDTFEQRVADYSSLLQRTYSIMKKEYPELLITNGSIVNTRVGSGHVFLKAILESGCGKSFDITNIHYYHNRLAPEKANQPANEFGFDGTLETFLLGFRGILEKNSCSQPIWLTEIGWSTTPVSWGQIQVTPAEQAMYVVRSHMISFSNDVRAVTWFALTGEPFGLLDLQTGPKPALAAYAHMASVLSGHTKVTRLPDRTVYVYRCQGTADDVLVVWALEDTKWKLPDNFAATQSSDMYGEDIAKPGKELLLTPSPRYIYGKLNAQETK